MQNRNSPDGGFVIVYFLTILTQLGTKNRPAMNGKPSVHRLRPDHSAFGHGTGQAVKRPGTQHRFKKGVICGF